MKKCCYFAFSGTDVGGHKIGDHITAAHIVRLMIENEPHEQYILSLNPQDPLAFVFDQVILEYNIEVIWDNWTPGDLPHIYRVFDQRRRDRMIEGRIFNTYKEIYLRTAGGDRQGILCGGEKGLGRRNIFEYIFFGQEQAPALCLGGAHFCRKSLGYQWKPVAPKRSVFVAPIAISQSNDVFTMEWWRQVIERLLAENIELTVNTPNEAQFGNHPRLTYSYQPGNIRGLFDQIRHQQLVLCGNTGIGWIAGACGVPLIAGEPDFFWFMDYRYRECGVQSVVDIFGSGSGPGKPAPRVTEPVEMVLRYLERL